MRIYGQNVPQEGQWCRTDLAVKLTWREQAAEPLLTGQSAGTGGNGCLTLEVQGNALCGHQCFQEENNSNGTEELEWRCAKSQKVIEAHLLQTNSTACEKMHRS